MLPGRWCAYGRVRPSVLALLLLFFLGGCSDPDPNLNPDIFAEDSTFQNFQRIVTPESYWQDKVKQFALDVEDVQIRFSEESQKYRDLLDTRRKQVADATVKAKASGKDPKPARHEIVRTFREQLDPLRASTRGTGKELRKKMDLLAQARQALAKARE
jgi:hypothetical protein